jgi:hypothetical protein
MVSLQAGLQGAEKQQEARQKLQQRQNNLSGSSQEDQTHFFPPDFARHYKVRHEVGSLLPT